MPDLLLSTSYSVSLLDTIDRSVFLASSIRSWRTSHHGDYLYCSPTSSGLEAHKMDAFLTMGGMENCAWAQIPSHSQAGAGLDPPTAPDRNHNEHAAAYLGHEQDANDDGDGPNPLDGVGDTPSPLVGAAEKAVQDASREHLADDPLGDQSVSQISRLYHTRHGGAMRQVARPLTHMLT